MSYDVSIGPYQSPLYEINYTSNNYPMWRKAVGGSLGDLDGMNGKAAAVRIEQVLRTIRADRPTYTALELPSKQGTVATFTGFLESLRNACLKHPRALVHVSA